jgi:hypothetical protein
MSIFLTSSCVLMNCLIDLVNGEGELVHLVVGRQLYRVPWHTRPKLQLSFTNPGQPVFQICGYLRRIRILGSVHWIADPDLDLNPDHALFGSGTYCRYIYMITSVFKDIKSLRSHKTDPQNLSERKKIVKMLKMLLQ